MGPFILFQLIRLLDLANTSSVFYQNFLEELSSWLIYMIKKFHLCDLFSKTANNSLDLVSRYLYKNVQTITIKNTVFP